MLSRREAIATIAQNWLTQFETALAKPDDALLQTLFSTPIAMSGAICWRSLLASIRTVNGGRRHSQMGLGRHIGRCATRRFQDRSPAAPRRAM